MPLPPTATFVWLLDSTPKGNFLYFFDGSKLLAMRFDPSARRFNPPFEVKFVPGSPVTLKPSDWWAVRGPGLVMEHKETTSSVWLMQLPR